MSLSDLRYRQIQSAIKSTGWEFDPQVQAFQWPGPVGWGCPPMEPELFYRSALSLSLTREELTAFMERQTAEQQASRGSSNQQGLTETWRRTGREHLN